MNKTKMILAATGGTIAVVVLAMAYVTWTSFAAKTAAREGDEEEGVEGLDTVMETAIKLSAKKPYPCADSVKALVSNRSEIVSWRDEALKLASRGDRPVVPTTPAAFKEFIVGDAKRIASLPGVGGPGGTLVSGDFDFGPFKPYISEGKMPTEAELPVLQRKWDDVATIAETLASCGIVRMTGIAFKEDAAKSAAAQEKEQPSRQKKRGRRQAREAQESNAKEASANVSHSYVITFLARPPALVKSVNAFATTERFMVVDDFSFQRDVDVIVQAFGADEKKDESASQGRRRRGRRGAIDETFIKAGEAAAKKSGIVTDPSTDPPFMVTMTISVYDFRSLEETKEKDKEEAK